MWVPVWADDGLSNSTQDRILHVASVLLWVIFMSQKGPWAHAVTFERARSLHLSLVWAKLVFCTLVGDVCCSRVHFHSQILDVNWLPSDIIVWHCSLWCRGSSTHGSWKQSTSARGSLERMGFSQHRYELLVLFFLNNVIRQQNQLKLFFFAF